MAVKHSAGFPYENGNSDSTLWWLPCIPILRELWRRIQMESVVEFPMLKTRWKLIVMGGLFQYVHGMCTQLEHRLHQPRELLMDLGFEALPELDDSKTWVSEVIFYSIFGSFLLWLFSPFFLARKKFYTAVLFCRLLMVLVVCQALRIVSFLSTQLPAPHYHCRVGQPTAQRSPADHWWDHLIVNPAQQSTGGCGDLIFSSHTTFSLVAVLAYNTYGQFVVVKVMGWIGATVLSFLIIASRKHYTVDIVVAWYTVPLVFYHMHRRWTTHRDMRDDDSGKNDSLINFQEPHLRLIIDDGSDTQKSSSPGTHPSLEGRKHHVERVSLMKVDEIQYCAFERREAESPRSVHVEEEDNIDSLSVPLL